MEMVCNQISKRFVDPPSWWAPPPKASEPPCLRCPDGPCYVDRGTGVSRLCVRCQATLDEEERKVREEKEKELLAKKEKMKNKGAARDRMKKKFAAAKAKKAKEGAAKPNKRAKKIVIHRSIFVPQAWIF